VDSRYWTRLVRRTKLFLIAFVRSDRDQKYAGLVDDVMRASDARLTVWTLRKAEPKLVNACVKRAIATIDPFAVLDIRCSDSGESLWIQFGDGLSGVLKWKDMNLTRSEADLLPDTLTVAADDPQTVELQDSKGVRFEIDSRSLRALVDPTFSQSLKREAEKEMTEVGERLKSKRSALKVSQEELARRTGLEQGLISKLECGKHQPRFDTLRTYAEGLGLSVADLLEG